jgi:septal ring-binding cell division protein DamX
MEQKQRFFIYGRKEMGVLVLLGLLVAIFAFTLGVHLGKRVTPKAGGGPVAETSALPTLPDKVPNQQEIGEESKNTGQRADEALGQALHEEVLKTGIKLDQGKTMDLPKESKGEKADKSDKPVKAGEPTSANASKDEKSGRDLKVRLDETEDSAAEENRSAHHGSTAAVVGKYTLQIGSYPSLREAQQSISELPEKGLKPFIKSADIKGKGKWYRVFAGVYGTRQEAETAGVRMKAERTINSFVVSKLTD